MNTVFENGALRSATEMEERLLARIAELEFGLKTVLGDADHGRRMTWEERIRIGREALSPTRIEGSASNG